jgi:hypothetical protein
VQNTYYTNWLPIPLLSGSLSPRRDGEDGLQIWRVAANILHKHRGQSTRGGSPGWGLDEGLTTPHWKK